MRIASLCLVLLGCLSGTILRAQNLSIHCGKLIDGTGAAPREQVTLVIEQGKIARITNGYEPAPPGGRLLDWRSRTVLPGLIDCHVHIDHEHSETDLADEVRLEPEDMAFRAAAYARITLRAGFTTVRDLGGTGVNLALRRAIGKGLAQGPRIVCAGSAIGSTGGHVDPSGGFNRTHRAALLPADEVANGPDDCRRAVRKQIQLGADVIKIAATGGVLSHEKDGSRPQFSQAEMEAVVQTAADYGLKVAAHAHGAEGIKRALRAGVASIEHGTLMDDEAIGLFKKTGAYYVPTLTAGHSVADSAKKPGYFPALIAEKAKALGPRMQATFSKAYKAGVKIAFGTDAGVYRHGLNYLEFVYMVEAGMKPMDAIVAATRSAADLLGISTEVGTLEPGKTADVIAVDGDPLKDIAVMGKVAGVVQKGALVE